MRRFLVVAGLLIAVASPAAAQRSNRVVRTFSQEYARAGHETLVFDLNIGELDVVGADTGDITAKIDVRCPSGRDRDRCTDRAEDIRLDSSERRGRLYVSVAGTSMWKSRDANVIVTLTIPRDLNTELELGTGELSVKNIVGDLLLEVNIGEVTLENVSGNLTVDMGVGEVSVSMPQDAVGEVTLDNGVGETELRHRDGRNAVEGLLGGTDVHWDSGSGPKTVKIDLNVGEIRVRLH